MYNSKELFVTLNLIIDLTEGQAEALDGLCDDDRKSYVNKLLSRYIPDRGITHDIKVVDVRDIPGTGGGG